VFNVFHRVLCAGLILNLHVWMGGCGTSLPVSPDGFVRYDLSADQMLVGVTRSSAFGAASALEINPSSRAFRLVFPQTERTIAGTYEPLNGRPEVATLRFASGNLFVEFAFDGQRRVSSIVTSAGQTWRPSDAEASPVAALGSNGVDAYIAANQELVDAARRVASSTPGGGPAGGGPGGTNPPAGKLLASAQEAASGATGVLGNLAMITLAAAHWPALYFAFQISVGLNLAMAVIDGISAGGSDGSGGSPTSSGIQNDATLRVRNNLTSGVPIWYVVVFEIPSLRLPGGNLLGERAIPKGEAQDFGLPAGTRTFNVIVPSGEKCLLIYNRKDLRLRSGQVTEIVITDSDVGELYPLNCQN